MEEMFRSFYFSLPKSFTCPQKSLKVGQSDNADRPRFDNGSDELSTPSSTPEAPASWPPRPAPTGLGQTCVAGHVVSFPARSPSTPIRDRVVTLVVTSPRASLNALWRRETTVDVAFENWKAGSCILRQRVVYFETTCKYLGPIFAWRRTGF